MVCEAVDRSSVQIRKKGADSSLPLPRSALLALRLPLQAKSGSSERHGLPFNVMSEDLQANDA